MTLSKRLLSEFLGTSGLLIVVVGSGIMGESLSQGNVALALLANSLATGAGLYALIQTFRPISGSHFNPAVSLIEWRSGRLSRTEFVKYTTVQVFGAVAGVWITHLIFGQQVFQLSSNDRSTLPLLASEIVATSGLILVIMLSGSKNVEASPASVALFVTSAYWCTSSTSFANPAVTIARSLTNTFSGIFWPGVPFFIAAQFIGASLAYFLAGRLNDERT